MTLYEFDAIYSDSISGPVCGVDEAGRGSLAGPVYAAAVILPPDVEIIGLNDSKKLSEKKRQHIYGQIRSAALCFHVATATEAEIEEHNILGASLLAMRRAVAGLRIKPGIILVDGNKSPFPEGGAKIETVVGGDAKSASIAAASILAKVERDAYMRQMDEKYPGYGFAKHKGYPTRAHYIALDTYGPSDIHRRGFLKKWSAKSALHMSNER